MPGHAGSPYWAAVDFDSEGEDEPSPTQSHRVYLDPWDSEAYGAQKTEQESSQGDNMNSLGEPVSASFYYVPTKSYDEDEEIHTRNYISPPMEVLPPDYSVYASRKRSKALLPEFTPEFPGYISDVPIRDRRRSMYMEEPMYVPHPMIYEPLYPIPVIPPAPPGYLPVPPRHRVSMVHHPEYVMPTMQHAHYRRHSRFNDAYECFAYESLAPEYEDWARPFPKAAPENFHLSRYGHLQIDYSCSWNSLDRLIRNH